MILYHNILYHSILYLFLLSVTQLHGKVWKVLDAMKAFSDKASRDVFLTAPR